MLISTSTLLSYHIFSNNDAVDVICQIGKTITKGQVRKDKRQEKKDVSVQSKSWSEFTFPPQLSPSRNDSVGSEA